MTVADTAFSTRENICALMKRLRGMNDSDYLLYMITYHAAPTLLGKKPATLVCPDGNGRNLGQALDNCVPCLARTFGVKIASFRNGAGALLYLIYRPELLGETLAQRDAAELLAEAGYDSPKGDVDALLEILRHRCSGPRFPHEIGVFLGYPVDDVRRFMTDGGKGCRASGCWKTYADPEHVRRCSELYRLMRLRAAELIVRGADLRDLAVELRSFAA